MPFDRLQHFASVQMRQSFEWGVSDCVTFPADWIAEVCHVDPMSGLRGRYDSAAGCQRLTGFFTDPAGAVAQRMDFLDPAPAPRRGDVGLVMVALGGQRQTSGAIHLGGGKWLARAPQGITDFSPAKVLLAWSVDAGLEGAAA